ncbi:class I SAM-dependent methyltransferase [Rhodospirillaceae bacterium SYSU D60014]|uniref:class I SAM-dependent methyltransferase n=1 Tax=Virgifigura deserti TaxID=2268457 RepID=UPI000E67665A
MSNHTISMTDLLYEYLLDNSLREPDLLRALREETAGMPYGGMQIAPDQGQFMGFLVELTGARRALEVGTFTGYSALCVTLAMPPEGRLVACDVSETYTAVARRYWEKAGVADRIDLRLAPALDTLDSLIREGDSGSFDFAFIDADKKNYDGYYERALKLVRPGGLIAVDNVLWHGAVADRAADDEDTEAIRALNAKLKDDSRVTLSLVPIGDGLTLARRRA